MNWNFENSNGPHYQKKIFVYINLPSSHNVLIVAFKLININKTVKWDIMEHMP